MIMTTETPYCMNSVQDRQFKQHILLNGKHSNGDNSLMWATRQGNVDAIRILIQKYALPLNHQNYEGETALHIAITNENIQIVECLIENGSNINLPNIRGETPLHVAAALGHNEIVKLLVREGASIEAEDECGDTPLHFAVREEKLFVIEYLLSVGANSDHKNEDGESSLDLAESVASNSVVQIFEKYRGNDIMEEITKDFQGASPSFVPLITSREIKLDYSLDRMDRKRLMSMLVDDDENNHFPSSPSQGISITVPKYSTFTFSSTVHV
eukprot:TRINITY_DN3322_c0_g1_i1.p1 TRINITY_DN3322_c0_g1~~TRINITY_DN3322_c0_g1_i1.p1  ORF type:complete len:270 (-),score=36.73 TRINITY_DN3322_c0_g1_i1:183-992(-)